MNNPTPAKIKEARTKAGLTQAKAAELVHGSESGWRKWEAGDRPMNLAAWELFLIKTAKAQG